MQAWDRQRHGRGPRSTPRGHRPPLPQADRRASAVAVASAAATRASRCVQTHNALRCPATMATHRSAAATPLSLADTLLSSLMSASVPRARCRRRNRAGSSRSLLVAQRIGAKPLRRGGSTRSSRAGPRLQAGARRRERLSRTSPPATLSAERSWSKPKGSFNMFTPLVLVTRRRHSPCRRNPGGSSLCPVLRSRQYRPSRTRDRASGS